MGLIVLLWLFSDVYHLVATVGYLAISELERFLCPFTGKEFFVVSINPFNGSRVVRRQNPLLEAEPYQVIVFAFGSRAICGLVGAEVINHFGQLLLGLLIVGHIFPLLCESTDRKNGRSETRHAVKTGQTG